MFDAVHATNVKDIVRWDGLLIIKEFSIWWFQHILFENYLFASFFSRRYQSLFLLLSLSCLNCRMSAF